MCWHRLTSCCCFFDLKAGVGLIGSVNLCFLVLVAAVANIIITEDSFTEEEDGGKNGTDPGGGGEAGGARNEALVTGLLIAVYVISALGELRVVAAHLPHILK